MFHELNCWISFLQPDTCSFNCHRRCLFKWSTSLTNSLQHSKLNYFTSYFDHYLILISLNLQSSIDKSGKKILNNLLVKKFHFVILSSLINFDLKPGLKRRRRRIGRSGMTIKRYTDRPHPKFQSTDYITKMKNVRKLVD